MTSADEFHEAFTALRTAAENASFWRGRLGMVLEDPTSTRRLIELTTELYDEAVAGFEHALNRLRVVLPRE